MNAEEATEIARRLEASGVEIITPQRQGGNVVGYQSVTWTAAMGRCMAAFGWAFRLPDEPKQARVLKFRGGGAE